MIRTPVWALLALFSACASGPDVADPTQADPEVQAEFQRRKEAAAAQTAAMSRIERVLIDLDKTMDSYTAAVMNAGNARQDQEASKLETFIRRTVNKHLDALITHADQTDYPSNRAIAVAALGFSGSPKALNPLLNAARDTDNPELVNNAVFGLAKLTDPRTPPLTLARVMNNTEFDATIRRGAAWALFQLQQQLTDADPVFDIWREVVSQPIDAVDEGILVSAIRGLGARREATDASQIDKFVSHPVPQVRMATAVALGRMGNPESARSLMTLVGTAETSENVRLAARKGLQALAGGLDRGYDVEEWSRVFEFKD